jgi:hypothetical protein
MLCGSRTYSFIFDIRYFALATLPDVWTAFIMRFLTCADSDADTAVGCGGDGGDEDDEEPNGLRPPKDIFGCGFDSELGGTRSEWLFYGRSPVRSTRRIRASLAVGKMKSSAYSKEDKVGFRLILT